MSKSSVLVVEGARVVKADQEDEDDVLDAELETGRKKYPRLEQDCQDKFGHVYYGLPKGLRADNNEISPVAANEADLLPGETPVAQFDVYFPGKLIPMWLFVLYTLLTFGLFFVYYFCSLYFISKGCCVPSTIEFQRGRLMVTNKGRVLLWKTDFTQNGGSRVPPCLCLSPCVCGLDLALLRCICGPVPVTYGGLTTTGQYMLKDIAEIVFDSVKTPSYLCGIGPCAGSFSGSIRIYFKKFDTANQTASTLRCSSVSAYEQMTNAMFAAGFYFGDSNAGTEFIEITSTKVSESTYDYENRKADGAFRSLGDIYSELNKLVIASRPGGAWTAPSGLCRTKLEGATVVDAAWGSVSIVDEKKVELPRDYAPLAPGEAVVAAQSNMYMMTCMDWFWSFLSCGLYFLCVVGDKRKIRPALVLTNHRLMEICPSVDNACLAFCPKCLADCCFPVLRGFVVRSLYPRYVFSGVLSREKFSVTASLCTDAGAVSVTFDQVPSDTLGDELKAETKFGRKLNFCHALMSAATRRSHFQPGEEETLALTKEEKVLFPMAAGEVPLARYVGQIADDLCGPVCSKQRTWHPGCCLACSCGAKPMYSKGSMTLTTTSLYVFQEKSNKPFGCWGPCAFLVKKNDWQLMWTPLSHVLSAEVDTTILGRDNCITRCFQGTFCGNNCCPQNKSILTVNVKTKTSPAGDGVLKAEVGNLHMFKSLRVEPEVAAFREQLARVQTQLTAVGPSVDSLDVAAAGGGGPDGVSSMDMGTRM